MRKKIFLLSLLVIGGLVLFTGCDNTDNKTNSSKYKSYECRYSKDDNDDGKRYLTKYIIELNDKNEPLVYKLIAGFYNYGSKTEGYNDFCNGLKDNVQKDLLEKYKDAVSMDIVCDDKNNYEAYTIKEYQINKIKDIDEFSGIYDFLKSYIKDDGTFDLDAWKNYFNTDSLKAGNYSCDF